MTGPITLKSQKGLLSRYCNHLERILDENHSIIGAEIVFYSDDAVSKQAQSLALQLQSTSKLVSEALASFTATVDLVLNSPTKEQEAQIDEYINRAHAVLERARLTAVEIECKHASACEHRQAQPNSAIHSNNTSSELGVTQLRLPTIPIPPFRGQIWEFQNFWTIFAANVHNQPLSKLQKFNYLLEALQGEARETIRRYPVTEENYDHAIDLLRSKYGDEVKIIACLQSRLESAKAEKTTIHAQRRLLEYIIPITTQLEEKGVFLNGPFLAQKILAKFSVDLQRKVLASRLGTNTQRETWILKEILEDIDKIITTEEKIEDMVQKNLIPVQLSSSPQGSKFPDIRYKPTKNFSCIFCHSTNHKSLSCNRYSTLSERRAVFRESNRCLNCAKPGHLVKDCSKEGCQNCDRAKHHFTLCPSAYQKEKTEGSRNQTYAKGRSHAPSKQTSTQQSALKATKQQTPDREQTQTSNALTREYAVSIAHEQGTVLSNTKADHGVYSEGEAPQETYESVLLLTGLARVKDVKRERWKDVEILLDSGADQSFITHGLAEELELKSEAEKRVSVYTFGTESPKQTTCDKVTIDLWDQEGNKHKLQLYTTKILTAKGKDVTLSATDWDYIIKNNVQLLKKRSAKPSRPQILLGCDQLWNFLDVTYPRYVLPSGLWLIPSKLGYLLTGKKVEPSTQQQEDKCTASTEKLSIHSLVNFNEELERWDKYWTMDSAGICEFTGTKNAEKQTANMKVAEFFENTIEKRDDGYYIRFPYKENHPPLPSNKAIALKRLRSVLEMLQRNPQLLRDYDQTFQAQQQIGIIEEVNDSFYNKKGIVHYIPHQPVLTPQKSTTKLRIVFDASAHFSGSPSLNDILHQGPLILPELYAMLVRFRIPKYIITSDVEKAFLQVHLHEDDRDATRFLWVRNIDQPFDSKNIVTYRFTRVTFGLNVSPYLLGATVIHHLRCAVTNTKLANEIKNNLYVDNLILSAESANEAAEKALESRKIFGEMGMNLREFLSNCETLHQHLPKIACATSSEQKVLGIKWDAKKDCLNIHCTLDPPEQLDTLTKRIVARQIASIYDPLGWLVPLLIRAKNFQQKLWKQGFNWDTKLPLDIKNEWFEITNNLDNFEKTIPRRIDTDANPLRLAVFADASDMAIATCAYLFNNNCSSLVMAKSKLPSIKTKTTTPKLEMNALTIATRLALSVSKALKGQKAGCPTTIHIFSDSQIALSWLSTCHRNHLGVLVENRIKEIRQIVNHIEEENISVFFGYINSLENPADAGTRGLTKSQLHDHFWWTGPNFLNDPVEQWPNPLFSLASHTTQTATSSLHHVFPMAMAINTEVFTYDHLLNWNYYGSFTTAKRNTALVLRFVRKLIRNQNETLKTRLLENIPELKDISPSNEPLRASDIRAAKLALIRNHQLIYLTKSYRKSMDNTLRLYQDDSRIWRSKGRLKHSSLKEQTKNPIFIAPNTALAQHIIRDAHGLYHRGIEHTIATVREQFWIPRLRQQVRKLTTKCVMCRRFNALPYRYPDMTDLPPQRVLRSYPFQHTGLDFFDLPPCNENGEKCKLYGCIFTCAVTRLIHLEVVRSMATNEFLNALRRFVARRGNPSSITCDNAPTFLLSKNILDNNSKHIDEQILRTCTNMEIQWNHITPYAPWQGGFYERLIKSIKQAIYKAMRTARERSFDEILTFVVEVEACLNSRPLTYQGTTLEELCSVRPIDFLQKDITLTLPILNRETNKTDPNYVPPEELRILQYREQVTEALQTSCLETERFWKIWQEQYLTSLRETHKRLTSNRKLGQEKPAVGDVVLISDPVLPRNEWKMGRITATQEGTDGKTMEQIREELRQTKQELQTLHKELNTKNEELKNLLKALPHLPNPERLYLNIVDRCNELYRCTTRVTNLENLIATLRRSTEDLSARRERLLVLEFNCEKLLYEFQLLKCQLGTLFAAPPLLCATGKVSRTIWNAWMQHPQFNEAGKPLLMKPDLIEGVIADQLQLLEDFRSALHEIRSAIMDEDHQKKLESQEEIRKTLADLQATLNSFISASEKHYEEQAAFMKSTTNTSTEEELPRLAEDPDENQEDVVIQANADYFEEIETDNEEAIVCNNENIDNNDEVAEEAPQEVQDREMQEQDDDALRAQMEQQILQLEQARNNFRQIIDELQDQPVCAPRRFGRGTIHHDEDRYMRCAFCHAIGNHYSDSCYIIQSVQERRRMIEDRGKCIECLETCFWGKRCPKYYTRCFHCREYGHHSALCELPETSETIAERLSQARRGFSETTSRIESLRRSLEQLRH